MRLIAKRYLWARARERNFCDTKSIYEVLMANSGKKYRRAWTSNEARTLYFLRARKQANKQADPSVKWKPVIIKFIQLNKQNFNCNAYIHTTWLFIFNSYSQIYVNLELFIDASRAPARRITLQQALR